MTENRYDQVKDHWENQKTVSLRDTYLKDLEMRQIISFIKEIPQKKMALEIGCGDGEGTKKYQNDFHQYIAVDYSKEMLKKASEELKGEKALLVCCDVRFLPFKQSVQFDCIISERCLINMPDKESQKTALKQLGEYLNQGGRFIFMEGTADGLERVNEFRNAVGLNPIPMPWHNIFFHEEEIEKFLSTDFNQLKKGSFALYYLNSRVLNAAVSAPNPPQYESPINENTYKICLAMEKNSFLNEVFEKTIGQIFYLFLEKR